MSDMDFWLSCLDRGAIMFCVDEYTCIWLMEEITKSNH